MINTLGMVQGFQKTLRNFLAVYPVGLTQDLPRLLEFIVEGFQAHSNDHSTEQKTDTGT